MCDCAVTSGISVLHAIMMRSHGSPTHAKALTEKANQVIEYFTPRAISSPAAGGGDPAFKMPVGGEMNASPPVNKARGPNKGAPQLEL